MKSVILQAGHQNAKNNCDAQLAKGTGAPGEAEFTVRIRDRLSQILISKGIQVQLVDATFNCDQKANDKDYDLFLAIHYDADIYGTGGGFTDFPEPSTDGATGESQRLAKVIASEYFLHSGITEVNRSNANTRYYYMWKFLSAKTPCVIIECGVGKDEHDSVILADTERVANAIARGVCKGFGIQFDNTPPPSNPADERDANWNVILFICGLLNVEANPNDKEATKKRMGEAITELQVKAGQVSSLEQQVANHAKELEIAVNQAKTTLTNQYNTDREQWAEGVKQSNIKIGQLERRLKEKYGEIAKLPFNQKIKILFGK